VDRLLDSLKIDGTARKENCFFEFFLGFSNCNELFAQSNENLSNPEIIKTSSGVTMLVKLSVGAKHHASRHFCNTEAI
jgi:hypothetical protein